MKDSESAMKPRRPFQMTRRELLRLCGGGLGMTALGALLHDDGLLATAGEPADLNPLSSSAGRINERI